ncbi:MAG: heme exporter protein CcmD [Inquilinus sp.]|nr:heme exporter protein CcmD [Inquilinus sp.]
MSDFLAMGGYAVYVWSAYAIAALVLVVLLAMSLGALKRREAALRLLEAAREARPRGEPTGSGSAPVPESSR